LIVIAAVGGVWVSGGMAQGSATEPAPQATRWAELEYRVRLLEGNLAQLHGQAVLLPRVDPATEGLPGVYVVPPLAPTMLCDIASTAPQYWAGMTSFEVRCALPPLGEIPAAPPP